MDRIRLRAQELGDVVRAFNEANTGDLNALETLRPTQSDPDRQVICWSVSAPLPNVSDVYGNSPFDLQTALLVRRLNLLSREVDSEEMETASDSKSSSIFWVR
jgi:hypothetical protein